MAAKIIPFPLAPAGALTEEDKATVLLAADELVAKGGVELLAETLCGIHSELVLEAHADRSRGFGAMAGQTLNEVTQKIEQMIEEDLFRVEHYWSLPLIVHSPAGWDLTKDLWTRKILGTLEAVEGRPSQDELCGLLTRAHREVKIQVLAAIEESGLVDSLPVLESWRENERGRMRTRIDETILRLDS